LFIGFSGLDWLSLVKGTPLRLQAVFAIQYATWSQHPERTIGIRSVAGIGEIKMVGKAAFDF
jgi:hypothetical protein